MYPHLLYNGDFCFCRSTSNALAEVPPPHPPKKKLLPLVLQARDDSGLDLKGLSLGCVAFADGWGV